MTEESVPEKQCGGHGQGEKGRHRHKCDSDRGQFKQHILLNPSVTYAKSLQKELPELLLLTFDNRLQKAAQGEGLPRQP